MTCCTTTPTGDEQHHWMQWLQEAELPVRPASTRMKNIDKTLGKFVCESSTENTLTFPRQTGKERLWIHRRCVQLHLRSESTPGQGYIKSVRVTKPEGWTMPTVVKTKFRAEDRQKTKAKRKEMMSHWSRKCDDCGVELDAWGAMYHHSGTGPLCQQCIDDDEEKSGHKWEAKADFW